MWCFNFPFWLCHTVNSWTCDEVALQSLWSLFTVCLDVVNKIGLLVITFFFLFIKIGNNAYFNYPTITSVVQLGSLFFWPICILYTLQRNNFMCPRLGFLLCRGSYTFHLWVSLEASLVNTDNPCLLTAFKLL